MTTAIEQTVETYGIENWGAGYFDVNRKGNLIVRPAEGDSLHIEPLLPENTWDWFCVDGLKYHGKDLAIVWDRDGSRYKKGKGLSVMADGKVLDQRDELGKLAVRLPSK